MEEKVDIERMRRVLDHIEQHSGPRSLEFDYADLRLIADAVGAAVDGRVWQPVPYCDEPERLRRLWLRLDGALRIPKLPE